MSYDLMVFDPDVAPRDHDRFMAWYNQQTEWSEQHGYNDPAVSTPALRAWFLEMIGSFPPLNGPYADEDVSDAAVTDYSVGKSVIYAAFAWSKSDAAYKRVFQLAGKYRVGFFDVSSNASALWFPTANGGMEQVRST